MAWVESENFPSPTVQIWSEAQPTANHRVLNALNQPALRGRSAHPLACPARGLGVPVERGRVLTGGGHGADVAGLNAPCWGPG